MNSRIESLKVVAYGNSYPNWPDRWSYVNRLAARYNWSVSGRAVGGERSTDTAARIIAGAPAGKYTHGEADLILWDSSVNDWMGAGLAALNGYRNALTASLAWLSLEGVIEDARTDVISYSGSWGASAGPEWSGGSQRDMRSVTASAKLNTFGRGGKWAVGFYGLAAGTGLGGNFKLTAAGQQVGAFSTNAQCVASTAPAAGGGPRNWGCAAAVVDLPDGCPSMTLARADTGSGGGPYFDWYGKVNEATPPLIVLPSPVRFEAAGYNLNGSPGLVTDATLAAYAQVQRDVAALIGPHVQVVNVDMGWDPALMLLPDRMHPNQRGSAHIADRIQSHLDCLTW